MRFSEDEVINMINNGKLKHIPDELKCYKEKTPEKKTNKYNSKKVIVDGIKFDSKFESERYLKLKTLEKAGAIKDLKLQSTFELQPKFIRDGKTFRAIKYKADFVYYDVIHNKTIVEDTKGYQTKDYIIKKKLLLYKYPDIDFREVHKK